MKSSVITQFGLTTSGLGMLAALAALLLWASPVAAAQKVQISNTASMLDFLPGQTTVSPDGKVHIKGFQAVYMMQSDNPLVAGKLTVIGDFNGDQNLNGEGFGTAVFEVGTWDSSGFHSSGGRYQALWVSQGNLETGSTVWAAGHGVAGDVEGISYYAVGQPENPLTTVYMGWLIIPHAKN
jgi:hypothetical protein